MMNENMDEWPLTNVVFPQDYSIDEEAALQAALALSLAEN